MKSLVVISKFNENIDWLEKINHDILIYDKSDSPVDNVIHLRNVGREAGTLLYYIICNYTNLPDIIIYLQGDPRGNPIDRTIEEVIEVVNDIKTPELFYFSHGNVKLSEYWLKSSLILNEFLFENTDIMTKYSHGVQYGIPRENILNRPLNFYWYLFNEVMKFGNKELLGNKTDLIDGIDAWTLEPIWGNIFDLNKILKDNYKEHENN